MLDSLDDPRGAHIAVAPPVDAPPQQVDHATPLLAILRQIAETLAFLHASGVVHCDLKPSNVVVLSSRRPVLVDFGLAALLSDGPHRGDRGGAGTPHYMAPEQARRRRADGTGADAISPAADMYALGVMMFEAFAHRFPFEGEARAVVHLKQASDAPRLRSVAPQVPLELDALVAALLQIDPVARPSAAVVARALGALEAGLDPAPLATVPREGDRVQTVKVIVGREEPISRAIAATNRGRGHSAVVVMGPAGIGKSAVCAEVMARREPLTLLQARCYEREGGPNEIIDGLGNALLLALDARGLASLPENEHALARLAVVAPSLAQHGRSRGELPRLTPPRVQRALAVDALVSLLTQLGGGQPVCLWLEDLHWLDADGRTLLGDLFLRPAVPELTLLISMRPGDSEGHLLVCELERHARTAVERIVLGPLDQPDALRLVRERLGPTADAESPRILEAVRGAGGNPFLLEQLVDHTQSTELSLSTLSAIVEARVSRLGPAARGILEVLSVAARPVAEPVLMRAVKAAQGDLATLDASAPHVSALYTLSTISLIQRSASTALISLRHAALGGAALENVAPLRVRSIHLAIADALLACALPGSEIEAESVARHLVAAARNARAVAFLDVAAARAMTNLAFERALELDALALELAEPSTRQRAAIAARRGDASSALGRGVLAAGEYRTAARLEPDLRRALDLERQAAEELLRSGRIAEGTRSLDRVLDRLGMSRPRTRVGALAVLAKDTLEGS